MSEYVTKNLTILNDVQGANLEAFMKSLPAELRVSAWSKLTAGGIEKLDLAKSVHKWCVAGIIAVFNTDNKNDKTDAIDKTVGQPVAKKARAKKP